MTLFGFVWLGLLSVSGMAEAQWVQTSGPEECEVRDITADGPRILAVLGNERVFQSVDKGAHWTEVRTPSPSRYEFLHVAALKGLLFFGSGPKASFSADGGSSWSEIVLPPSKNRRTVRRFASLGSDILIGTTDGIYVCGDVTNDPTAVPVALPEPLSVWGLAVQGSDLYVGGDKSALFRIRRDGPGWAVSRLLPPEQVELNFYATTDLGLFAGTEVGLFRRSGDPPSWAKIDVRLPKYAEVSALAVAGRDLLAALDYPHGGSTGPGAVRLSMSDGLAWSPAGFILERTEVRDFTASGSDIFAATSDGVYRSSDGGMNWARTNSGLPVASRVQSLAAIGSRIFAGTSQDVQGAPRGNIHISDDDGKAWRPVGEGFPAHPFAPGLVALGTDLYAELGALLSLGQGIYLSKDQGRTWDAANRGLDPNARIFNFAVLGPNLYVLTEKGVFFTADRGANWTPLNEGLPGPKATCLAAGEGELFLCVWGPTKRRPYPSVVPALLSFLTGAGDLYGAGPRPVPPDGLLFYVPKNGTRWKYTHIVFPDGVECMAKIGDVLFVGNASGLYICENYAARQLPRALGKPHYGVRRLAVFGDNLAVCDASGIFVLKKDGAEWRVIDTNWPRKEDLPVLSLLVTDSGLYAGTLGGGVWRLPRADLDKLIQ